MTLRRTVMVALISSSLLTVGLLASRALTESTLRTLDERGRLANDITTTVAELDRLAYQFMVHPDERFAEQWLVLNRPLNGLINDLERTGSDDQSLQRMRTGQRQAQKIFEHNMGEPAGAPIVSGLASLHRQRIVEQLLTVSRSLANHAGSIHHASLTQQATIRIRGNVITFVVLGLILVVLAWLTVHLHRGVFRRREMEQPYTGRARVEDHKLVLPEHREGLGDLSRAFDRMIAHMRHSRELCKRHETQCASEERQRQLIDAQPELVWAAQPDGTVDVYNRAWGERLGVESTAPGFNWETLVNPEDIERWRHTWRRAIVTGELIEIELRLRQRDHWCWHRARVASLLAPSGRIVRWIGTMTDISESKAVEQRLRDSCNQAELLNQVALDLWSEVDIPRLAQRATINATALVGAEFGVLSCAVAGAGGSYRLLGLSGLPTAALSEFPVPTVGTLFHPSMVKVGIMRCDDIRNDDRFSGNASACEASTGHPRITSYLAAPLRSRSGEVIGAIFCCHPLAARFTIQHERLMSGIAALVSTAFDHARLIDLERRRHRQADERAAALACSNAELEQFAYICSHDLQEPLRMVISFLGLLSDRCHNQVDERARGYIRRAVDGASRMQGLIRDILSFSRVGHGERAEECFPLADAVGDALINLRMQINEVQARIKVPVLPVVRANRFQCVQLFQNLISNALKFRSDEVPLVCIHATPQGDGWQIEVKDNGIGIDPAHHRRIFQVFQRLHGREKFEGTGIGLSLCEKIVQAHGGRITVQSTPGRGATFRFTLPHAEAPVRTATPSAGHPVLSGRVQDL